MNAWAAAALHLSLLYAAVGAATSQVLLTHNSDTILPALISLLHWTPYYWGENRFGMLIPLLAAPFGDPAFNLLLQGTLIAWSGLLAVWLIVLLIGDKSNASVTTALTVAGVLLLFRQKAGLILLLQSNYLPPVALLLGGWFIYAKSQRPLPLRSVALAALLLLSFWINVSNVALASVLALAWPGQPRRERFLAVGLVATTNALSTWIASFFPGAAFREVLPPDQWFPSMQRLLSDASLNFVQLSLALLLLLGGFVLLLIRKEWRPAGVLVLASSAQIGLVALSEWVWRNGSDSRYISSPLFVLVTLSVAVVVHQLSRPLLLGQSSALAAAVSALLIVAVSTRAFGFPSLERGRQYLTEVTTPAAQSFGDIRCTHLIGDYWRVWMAVYHDLLVGHTPPRHGVTFRSDVIRHTWDREPQNRRTYCGACADPTLEFFRLQQGVPVLTLFSRTGAVCQWNVR